jgi:surface polysaccharide O-acyltransferase-like enzyme
LLRDRGPGSLGPFALALGLAAGVLYAVDHWAGDVLLRFALAFGLLFLGASLPDRPDPVTRTLEPLLLGVYLLHPLVAYTVVDRFLPLEQSPVAGTAVTIALCMLATHLLRRTPARIVL